MKTITIPAASNNVPGVYTEFFDVPVFTIISAPDFFSVAVGSQQGRTVGSGHVVGASGGPPLGRVTFSQTTSSEMDVTIDAGVEQFRGSLPIVSEQMIIEAESLTQNPMPNGGLLTLLGTRKIKGIVRTRKYIEIDNTSTGDLSIYLGAFGTPGNPFGPPRIARVLGNSVRRLDIAADLQLWNNSGGALNLTIHEVF